MTCAEIREQFSARADDALGGAESAALDAHLATCLECRREWERFAATVGLLRAVVPERAPAGFVDRVLAAARPQPWYRRLARGLLVPWAVKLPLEAAALVMVAGLAVLVFQRSSELQFAVHAPETSRETPEGDRLSARLADTPRADRAEQRAAPDAPRAVTAPAPKDQNAIAPDSRDAAQAAKAEKGRAESAPPRLAQQHAEEPAAARRQQADEPGPRSALDARAGAPAAGAVGPSAPARSGAMAATSPAESFGEAQAKRRERLAKEAEGDVQLNKLAVRVPPSVELSLATGDRAAAEAAVAVIVERLGGAVVPGAAPATLEIMVARDDFSRLSGDLARLGTLRTVRQPAELPEIVRIGLQLTP